MRSYASKLVRFSYRVLVLFSPYGKNIPDVLTRELNLYSVGNGYYVPKEPVKVMLKGKPMEVGKDDWDKVI